MKTPSNAPSKDKPVKVFVRIRPTNEQLAISNLGNKVYIEDGKLSKFSFDEVFTEKASQSDIFEGVLPIIEKAKEGLSGSIIVYGQTGCGKTYTMGTEPISQEEEGIIPRFFRHFFTAHISTKENQCQKLKLGFLEVYNDSLFDLLCGKKVSYQADGIGGIKPVGHTEEVVSTCDEALMLLRKGNDRRKVSATVMNPRSSRSHGILIVRMLNEKKNSYMQFVDLAGAEGVGRHSMKGQGFSEGVSINQDLLTVGKVLSALSDGSNPYIPYRESVLTRLLKNALGEKNNALMIACICPSKKNAAITLNTLRYAEKARNIKTKPVITSTIKKSGFKRPLAEVHDATPNQFKRGKKDSKHNATISTPGHKQPSRPTTNFSNSFATPLNRSNCNSLRKGPMTSSHNDLNSLLALPIQQPVFEDDSPSRFSSIQPIHEENSFSISPLLERMSSQLEKTMNERMNQMEDRVAQKVAGILLKGTEQRRQSKRLQKNEHTMNISDDQNMPSSADKTIADFIASARNDIQKKNEFGSLFQMAIKPEKENAEPYDKMNKEELLSTSHCIDDNLMHPPITSTAVNPKRLLRRSVRLSRKYCVNETSLLPPKECANNLPTQLNNCSSDYQKPMNNLASNCMTLMNASNLSSILYSDHSPFNQTYDFDCTILPCNNDPPTQRRRSTRIAAMTCTLKNQNLAKNPCSPKEVENRKRSKWHPTLLPSPNAQKEHQQGILNLINTGSLKKLQQLPTIGPKTAMVLYNYRKLYGGFKNLEDLRIVPGLPKSFSSRFYKANLILIG